MSDSLNRRSAMFAMAHIGAAIPSDIAALRLVPACFRLTRDDNELPRIQLGSPHVRAECGEARVARIRLDL